MLFPLSILNGSSSRANKMISNKGREIRRGRGIRMTKQMERLYTESKCRDCAVVVTRMDFAKILGKFTKVKIHYENRTTSKTRKNLELTSPNSRLKNNENGMVLIQRNAYNKHPVKDLFSSKKKSQINDSSPSDSNVLKENNRLKKSPSVAKKTNYKFPITAKAKHYRIIFFGPKKIYTRAIRSKVSLAELLPNVNQSILPSDNWSLDFYPKSEEPKEDKVYDRISAELEDMMNNREPEINTETSQSKTDEFPSILDILNEGTNVDVTKANQSNSKFNTETESNDVEAMLLGKVNSDNKEMESTAMEVDNTDITKLIADVNNFNSVNELPSLDDNPNSPSILDETLQKGIADNLPNLAPQEKLPNIPNNENEVKIDVDKEKMSENDEPSPIKQLKSTAQYNKVWYLTFKKIIDGKCIKSVTCPKNLKYDIEIDEKHIELLGAPKFISSLDDLKVLLQIVDESDLESSHIFHS